MGTISGVETDCNAVLVGGNLWLMYCARTFELQKALSQWSFYSVSIGGQNKIRVQHRTLATSDATIEEVLTSVGLPAQGLIPDDFSGTGGDATLVALNTALSPFKVQLYRSW